MTKIAGITMAAVTALSFRAARAEEEQCANQGAPGRAYSDASKPCPQQLAQADKSAQAGKSAQPDVSAQPGVTYEEPPSTAGSASPEPGSASPEPGYRAFHAEDGYDGSGNVGPGYYVGDPGESQFLLDTWTKGG